MTIKEQMASLAPQKLFVENYEQPKIGFSISHGLFAMYLQYTP